MKMIRKILFSVLILGLLFPGLAGANSFSDVSKGQSHYDAIMEMTQKGYISGYPDKTFKPNNPISRVHSALIMKRVQNLPDSKNVSKTLANINDVPVTHSYSNQIASVIEAGVFSGYADGTFRPNNSITREQMATVLVNIFDLEKKEKSVKINLSNVHPSHQGAVQIIADHGLTVNLNNYNPKNSVTRGQFASFVNRALQLDGESNIPIPTPEPKPDPKPQPKPEPKPNNNAQTDQWGNPKLGNPSGLPSGASKYDDKISSHYYNYSRSLPGGGSIQTVAVHSVPELITMTGKDIDGKDFIASYYLSDGLVRYRLVKPNLSDSALSTFYEVGRSFAKAYGME